MNNMYMYELVKKDMKTADMLQWHSNSILGAVIRLKTQKHRSDYEKENDININHTSMLIRLSEYEGEERRRWTQESLEHGVVLNLLRRRLERFDGHVWWYPLKPEYNEKRLEAGRRAMAIIGAPYDYQSLFRLIVSKVSVEARNFFCSENYLWCLGYDGIALTPNEMPKLGWWERPIQLI